MLTLRIEKQYLLEKIYQISIKSLLCIIVVISFIKIYLLSRNLLIYLKIIVLFNIIPLILVIKDKVKSLSIPGNIDKNHRWQDIRERYLNLQDKNIKNILILLLNGIVNHLKTYQQAQDINISSTLDNKIVHNIKK